MSGLLGGGGAGIAQQAPTTNLQVQTSANGNPVAIAYGTIRMAANLLWYGGFHYTASASGGSGKGGVVGGGKGGQSSGYNYFASFQFGICEGPINGFGSVWSNGNEETAAYYGLTVSDGAYSQSAWPYLLTNYGYTNFSGTVPASGPYTLTVTYATQFMVDNGVTGNLTLQQTSGLPTTGQYNMQQISTQFQLTFGASYAGMQVTLKNASYTQTFTIPATAPYTVTWPRSAAPQSVLLINATYTLASGVPSSGQYFTDGQGNYTFNSAQAGNTVVISYASNSQSPGFAAVGYSGIAWAGAPDYALGQSPSLQNFNWEIQGNFSNSVSGQIDADPSLVVADFLTNAKYGADFPSGKLGNLTNYQNYCLAQGLLVSFKLDTQSPASSILADLATCTNSEWARVDGKLNLVPYGDVTLTGNGKTYTPPSAPEYDLGDNDFIRIKGQDPVQLDRKRPVDANNWIQMSFSNRAIQYNEDTVEYKNEVLINKFRLRPMPTSSISNDYFADAATAQTSVNLQGQRQMILNVYTFTIDQRYILLDCMDIVSITDSVLGISKQWVRIKQITENNDYTLTIVAEEYLGGTGTAAVNTFQSNNGYSSNFNIAPGNVNAPVILSAPVQIATNTGLEVWITVSGGSSNYGGCQVWASSDDQNYKQMAPQIDGTARQGSVISDSGTSIVVDMTQSNSQLLSGNPIDSELANTLCIASNGTSYELFSYQIALLGTTPFNYTLSGLTRGLYGTNQMTWTNGTQFGRLDSQTFILPYNENQIGQDIYLKFLAFNTFGGGQQALQDVSPYIYTVQGPPIPPDMTGFGVTQNGTSCVFVWNPISDFGLKGIDIRYAPQGTSSWNLFTPLTEGTAGTEMTNAGVPPGTWIFAARARDIANQLSADLATVNLIVTNPNTTINQSVQEPNWIGTLVGGGIHHTGVIYPDGTLSPSSYSTIAAPPTPGLSYQVGGLLSSQTFFVKITYAGSGTETTPSPEASLLVPADNLLTVASPASSGNAVGYNVYVSTTTGTETLQNGAPIAFGTNWVMPTSGLVAGATPPSTNSTGWEVFDAYCPNPVTQVIYTTPTVDTGYNADLRVYFTQILTPGMGVIGTTSFFEAIDTWLTGQTDPGVYTPWTIGSINMRYIKSQITHTVASVPSFISDFTVIIDSQPQIEQGAAVVVPPGGTFITFPTPYHTPPNVLVSTGGGTALYASWSNITTLGFDCNVFNSTGTDVGGTVSWNSTGS
jgi:hypothetical protein